MLLHCMWFPQTGDQSEEKEDVVYLKLCVTEGGVSVKTLLFTVVVYRPLDPGLQMARKGRQLLAN